MKRSSCIFTASLIAVVLLAACNNQPAAEKKEETQQEPARQPGIKEENITYTGDGITMNGFVAYDTGTTQKRAAVLVIHEWWGLNDYPKMRARELAKLGYIAFAMDMYGNGTTTENPDSAGNMAKPFYTNPQKAKARIDAALATLKGFPETDSNKIAAIGYCFGGGMALNAARLGENVKGVVSFHGSLIGTPANKDLLKAKILVCHGADDKFVKKEEVDRFKKQMDSIKADYTFKAYPGSLHAFTNPKATEVGKKYNIPIAYNGAADTASWKDMQQFFDRIFK